MPRFAVIADDLTGANATGILFGKQGFRAISSLSGAACEFPGDPDVIVVNTESRAIEAGEAYSRVYSAARDLLAMGIRHFDKRIDSTLRGNMGAEIDAVLNALREAGTDALAVVVAAFPASGRSTVGGYHLVAGVPLERTDVASDPTCPVHTSSLPGLLASQSRHPVASISLSTVLAGKEAVAAALRRLYSEGKRVIAVDCVSESDMQAIARGAAECALPVVSADPGPFGAALAAALYPGGRRSRGRVLVVAGSVTAVTRGQISMLQSSMPCSMFRVNAELLVNGGEQGELEIERAVGLLADAAASSSVIGVMTAATPEDVLDVAQLAREMGASSAAISRRVADALADIAVRFLDRAGQGPIGVYGTGGDIIAAVCRACDARGIELIGEVLPLATYGRIVGGPRSGMPMVTKGGLVGGPDAAVKCVEHLIRSQEERA